MCFALAAVLFVLAAVNILEGTGPGGSPAFRTLYQVMIFIAPLLAVVTGAYLLRKEPMHY